MIGENKHAHARAGLKSFMEPIRMECVYGGRYPAVCMGTRAGGGGGGGGVGGVGGTAGSQTQFSPQVVYITATLSLN